MRGFSIALKKEGNLPSFLYLLTFFIPFFIWSNFSGGFFLDDEILIQFYSESDLITVLTRFPLSEVYWRPIPGLLSFSIIKIFGTPSVHFIGPLCASIFSLCTLRILNMRFGKDPILLFIITICVSCSPFLGETFAWYSGIFDNISLVFWMFFLIVVITNHEFNRLRMIAAYAFAIMAMLSKDFGFPMMPILFIACIPVFSSSMMIHKKTIWPLFFAVVSYCSIRILIFGTPTVHDMKWFNEDTLMYFITAISSIFSFWHSHFFHTIISFSGLSVFFAALFVIYCFISKTLRDSDAHKVAILWTSGIFLSSIMMTMAASQGVIYPIAMRYLAVTQIFLAIMMASLFLSMSGFRYGRKASYVICLALAALNSASAIKTSETFSSPIIHWSKITENEISEVKDIQETTIVNYSKFSEQEEELLEVWFNAHTESSGAVAYRLAVLKVQNRQISKALAILNKQNDWHQEYPMLLRIQLNDSLGNCRLVAEDLNKIKKLTGHNDEMFMLKVIDKLSCRA